MNDLISIIVPIYNVERYLERCVRSITSQTYKNLEIILVDDGSLDKCPEICDKLAEEDSRIKVLHKVNGGLSDARNHGIDNATGSYIMFIDSDDYIDSCMVEVLYNALINTKSDIAMCGIEFVDEYNCIMKNANPAKLKRKVMSQEDFWEELIKNDSINYTPCVVVWNKIYNRKIFESIRFDIGKIHEDEMILHKIISNCNKISSVQNKLYNYIQRSTSIMNEVYNVKRLDLIEAFLNRTNYFIELNNIKMAEHFLSKSISVLAVAYKNLQVKNCHENEKRLKEIEKLFRQVYKKMDKQVIPLKQRVYYFMISEFTVIYKGILLSKQKINKVKKILFGE